MSTREKTGYALIGVVILVSIVLLFSQAPIAQDIRYHAFADTRALWGIQNFWNVASNLLFLLVGWLGVYKVTFSKTLYIEDTNRPAYSLFFAGVGLAAFGSGYYHLSPDNTTLVWDRLPMTFGFMALFSIVIGEYISARVGRRVLFPFMLAGIASVVYWHLSEAWGQGDLRFYAVVQFGPVLLMPVILLCFKTRYTHAYGYWSVLIAYASAKLCEHLDSQIYNILGFVSGHSLKHIVAAIGVYVLLDSYEKRKQHG